MNINSSNRCVIKASLENNDEVRRFALETKELSKLYSILAELFLLNGNFSIRYKDDQGDIVLISNDIELEEAIIVCNNLIRIFIRKDGTKPITVNEKREIKEVKDAASVPSTDDLLVMKPPSLSEVPVFPTQNTEVTNGSPSIDVNTIKIVPSIDVNSIKIVENTSEKPVEKEPIPALKLEIKEFPFLNASQTREKLIKAKQDLVLAKERVGELKKQYEKEMKDVKKLKEEKLKQMEKEKDAPKKIMGRFVKHVTIPDNTELPPNTPFVKTWRFRNEAERPWPVKAQLIFVGRSEEDRLAVVKSIDVGTLAPGQEKDISISMITPAKQGHYVSYWRLNNPVTDKKFGQRVWVMINVVCDSSSSSGDEKDELEVVKKYGAALRQLQDMGFTDYKRNVKCLIKSDGDVTQAVKKLLKKMGKK